MTQPLLGWGLTPQSLTNVTPFTYRDNATYIELLREARDKVDEIIAAVNANAGVESADVTAINAAYNALVVQWNATLATLDPTQVNALVTTMTAQVNTAVADSANAVTTANAASATASTAETQVAAETTRAEAAEAAEVTRANAAIAVETNRATTAENTETTRAEAAESAETTRATNAENAEVTRAEAAESAEVTRATNAETSLGTRATTLENKMIRVHLLAANDTARTALATTCGWAPTVADPLIVFQTDTKIFWEYDGVSWATLTKTMDVTALFTKTAGSCVTTFKAVTIGKLLVLQFAVAGTGSTYAAWDTIPMLSIGVGLKASYDTGLSLPWQGAWSAQVSAVSNTVSLSTSVATTLNTGSYTATLSWIIAD